ncbi:MAG: hypothetical protein QNL89_07075, partial [Flavobacteriaceae bacterium]
IYKIWKNKSYNILYKLNKSLPLGFLLFILGLGGGGTYVGTLNSGVIYSFSSSWRTDCYGTYPFQHFEVLDSSHIGVWSQKLEFRDGSGQMSVITYHKTDSTIVLDKVFNYDNKGVSRFEDCYNRFLGEYKYKKTVKYGSQTYNNVFVKDDCDVCNDGWGIVIEKSRNQSNSNYSGGWSYQGYLFDEYRTKYPRGSYGDY